jgi:hypothetical protein
MSDFDVGSQAWHLKENINVLDSQVERLQNKLKAIKIYSEGVKEDFPDTKIWMDNIIAIIDQPS